MKAKNIARRKERNKARKDEAKKRIEDAKERDDIEFVRDELRLLTKYKALKNALDVVREFKPFEEGGGEIVVRYVPKAGQEEVVAKIVSQHPELGVLFAS